MHNLVPIEMDGMVDTGDGVAHRVHVFRFYFDGLIARMHPSLTGIEELKPFIVGGGPELVIQMQLFEDSFQFANLQRLVAESVLRAGGGVPQRYRETQDDRSIFETRPFILSCRNCLCVQVWANVGVEMAILIDLDKFTVPTTSDVARDLIKTRKKGSGSGGRWVLVDQLMPADLYSYLYAKFGPPNGLQNVLRRDDSTI